MKIVVIGPGALGSLLAASLALRSDHEVWLLDHKPERALRIQAEGLLLEEDGKHYSCPLHASADAGAIGRANLILLCVKTHDVTESLNRSKALFAENSLLICFQNGLRHLAVLKEELGKTNWAAGVTAQGATLVRPGHVRHAGRGITRVGFPAPQGQDALSLLKKTATIMTAAGLETEVVTDILDHIWGKLLINVGINALTAILNCPNGHLLESAEAKKRLEGAVREAAEVAKAKGIGLAEDPVAATLEVCKATEKNISSMLQDVRNKRLTEIDAINSAVVAEARLLGIPAPINEGLVRQVQEIEKGYVEKFS